jgi:hypothetical protein
MPNSHIELYNNILLKIEVFCKLLISQQNKKGRKLAISIPHIIAFQHLVKHTDATDIPVCANKKAKYHQTMKDIANWGYSSKGTYYGLKLHLTSDLKRNVLAIKLTSANVHETQVFMGLNMNLYGIFLADAAYISEKLSKEFHKEGERILFAKPRKNMKKLMTKLEEMLYSTRMQIELDFRNLKLFYGLITSLPRSVNGYLANYIYSLLAYLLA